MTFNFNFFKYSLLVNSQRLLLIALVHSTVNAAPLLNFPKSSQTNPESLPLLRIAVAANFAPALSKLMTDFNRQQDIEVQIISGASGLLFQQLLHGAPFDVFLSADTLRPQMLINANKAITSSLQTYAVGKIALWSASWPLTQLPSLTSVFQDLLTSQKRLAIANPETAPYGQAAKQVLVNNGLWQPLSKRLITGININQTFQQTRSQAVSYGIVATSQLKENNLLGIDIPVEYYHPLIQQLVILKSSKNPLVAQQFIDFLLTESSQNMLIQMGYQAISSLDNTK